MHSLWDTFVWPTLVAVLPVLKIHFLWVLGFTLAELLFGVDRQPPFRERLTNLQYVLLFFFLSPFAVILPSALAPVVAREIGPSLFQLNLPHWGEVSGVFSWPLVNLVLPFVPLLIFDFFYYWHHRLQHRVSVFWAIHRLHHSIESLNALSGYRVHWLEMPMRVLTITIPMAVIFDVTPLQGGWIALILSQFGIFIHSNLRLPLGPLTPVLTGPQLHRLHHSLKPEHQDRNYAAFFPVWDIVFGTYVGPKHGEWPVTGLAGGQRIGNVFHEMWYPFISWSRSLGRLFRHRFDRIPVIK